jgi:hypothetical protein
MRRFAHRNRTPVPLTNSCERKKAQKKQRSECRIAASRPDWPFGCAGSFPKEAFYRHRGLSRPRATYAADLVVRSCGCRMPSEEETVVGASGTPDRPIRSGARFAEHAVALPSTVLSVAGPLPERGDPCNNDSTTGTSLGDRLGESIPSYATRRVTDWHRRRSS